MVCEIFNSASRPKMPSLFIILSTFVLAADHAPLQSTITKPTSLNCLRRLSPKGYIRKPNLVPMY